MIAWQDRSAASIARILSSVSAGRFRNQDLFALFRIVRIRLRRVSSIARLSAAVASTLEPGVYSSARFLTL